MSTTECSIQSGVSAVGGNEGVFDEFAETDEISARFRRRSEGANHALAVDLLQLQWLGLLSLTRSPPSTLFLFLLARQRSTIAVQYLYQRHKQTMGCQNSKESVLNTVDDSVHVMLKHDKKMQIKHGEKPHGYIPRAEHPLMHQDSSTKSGKSATGGATSNEASETKS